MNISTSTRKYVGAFAITAGIVLLYMNNKKDSALAENMRTRRNWGGALIIIAGLTFLIGKNSE